MKSRSSNISQLHVKTCEWTGTGAVLRVNIGHLVRHPKVSSGIYTLFLPVPDHFVLIVGFTFSVYICRRYPPQQTNIWQRLPDLFRFFHYHHHSQFHSCRYNTNTDMKRPISSRSWEDEAAELLGNINGPKMIVLDLDFTVMLPCHLHYFVNICDSYGQRFSRNILSHRIYVWMIYEATLHRLYFASTE